MQIRKYDKYDNLLMPQSIHKSLLPALCQSKETAKLFVSPVFRKGRKKKPQDTQGISFDLSKSKICVNFAILMKVGVHIEAFFCFIL